jgi:hypothetical protein
MLMAASEVSHGEPQGAETMASKNGQAPGGDEPGDDDLDDDEEYNAMMLLERLESLEEEMEELEIATLDDLRTRIRDLHAELGE